MAELVSANTRNYLFLTLSQYNNESKVVPARVSMRRDQAFWEGGNSFIACESFRISSSPNPGGLYYGKVPKEWYMGVSQNKRYVPDDEEKAWPQLVGSDVDGSVDSVIARDIEQPTSATVKCRFGLNKMDPRTSETKKLLMRLGRYLNPFKLTQGSYVKLIAGADITTWVKGIVQEAPSQTITGLGIGDHGFFQPTVNFVNPNYFDGLDDFTTPWETQITFADPGNSDLRNSVARFIGTGCFLECAQSTNPNHLYRDPVGVGPMFEILAPAGLVITDVPDAMKDGQLNGFVTWNGPPVLEADSLCSFVKTTLPDVDAAPVVAAVKSVDDWISHPDATGKVTVNILLGYTAVGTAILDAQKAQGPVAPIMTLDFQPLYMDAESGIGIGANCTIKVTDWTGKNAAQNPVPKPPPLGKVSNAVYLGQTAEDEVFHVTRRPTLDEDLTVYTPNELFYLFNRSDESSAVPWTLNTDENGGFEISWNPASSSKDYQDFVISKAMVDSLGLNTFMTCQMARAGVDTKIVDDAAAEHGTAFMVTCCDESLMGMGTPLDKDFQNCFYTVRSEYLRNPDAGAFIPEDPLPANRYGTEVMFTQNYNATKPLVLLSCKKVVQSSKESRQVKIFPTLELDDENIQYYRYRNLPPHAVLGNTQQVSIESWSTYSQIDLVIPNLPFQPMLGSETDARILASLRLPFINETSNAFSGAVSSSSFEYYGDLLYNSDSSRSYLRITTDQALYDVDVEARLIRRDGTMDLLRLPYKGQFQIKLRFLQTE